MSAERTEIQKVADGEALSRAAAGLFARTAREAVSDRGRFTVALPGGSTPRRMLERLATEPFRSRIPWEHVELFWGDERAVPPEHPDSNFRMAQEALLSSLPVAPEKIHRMPAEREDLDSAAVDYQKEIAAVFGVDPRCGLPAFDLVLLGMGTDGHTLSLFPRTRALEWTGRWVVPSEAPGSGSRRLTLTPGLVNQARCVCFLVTGAGKAATLREVLEGPQDPERLPSQQIRPPRGRRIWMVDREAARGLTGKVIERPSIAPSILSADFGHLAEQVRQAEEAGADRIHVDVMDGHFVPNLSMGPVVVRGLRSVTDLPLETHLMVTDPGSYLEAFAEAGSDSITFHQEVTEDVAGMARRIRELGMGVGMSVRPATPAEALADGVADVDLILVMTVEPGFGGQALIPETLEKTRRVRELITTKNPTCELEVDGGIHAGTVSQAVEAGARVLVAGSAVFGAPDGVARAMERLRSAFPR